MEKDLNAVVHDSKEETEEIGLETVEVSNGWKPVWFNLKVSAILYVFKNWLCFLFANSLIWVLWPIFAFSVAVIIDSDSLIFSFWIKCSLSWYNKGLIESWKRCLNLCSRKSFKPKRSLVISYCFKVLMLIQTGLKR